MTSFRSDFIETGQPGVRIHVSLSETTSAAPPSESAPTVVFLHYWGGSIRTWTDVPARVAAAGYPTANIDFRGWGQSTGPAEPDAYSIKQLADDVVAVLTNLQRRRVVLVGVSMGAKVAQVVAHKLATKDQPSVVVVAAVLCSPAPATALQLPEDMREQQLHAYDGPESASFVARNVLTQSHQGGVDSENKPLPGFFVEDMFKGNPQARAAWPAYAMGEDVTATSLGSLASPPPVLVLAAEKDIVEPLDRVKSGVLASIPGAELEVVSGAGHLSSIDAPEAVADAIVRFVGKAAK